eukprot:GSMAST32.ASY1.ANO1.2532.1 assembled CDS
MGICGSSKISGVDFWSKHPNLSVYKHTFEALKIDDDDLEKMHTAFLEMDDDASGEISIKEFFGYLEMRRTAFAKRCFSMFDADSSGELDFRELAVALWNYCTCDTPSMLSFAFDLYDLDNSGEIDKNEMELIVKEVYGSGWKNNSRAKQIMKDIKVFCDPVMLTEVSKKDFMGFARTHPALLFPANQLQTVIRKKVLGRKFWLNMAKKRKEAFKDKNVDINYLIASVKGNHFIGLLEGEQDEDEKKYGVHNEIMKANSSKARKNRNGRRMKRLKLTPAEEEKRRDEKRQLEIESEMENAKNKSGERMPEGNMAMRMQRRKLKARNIRQMAKDARLQAAEDKKLGKRSGKSAEEIRQEALLKKAEGRLSMRDLVKQFEAIDKEDPLDKIDIKKDPYDPTYLKKIYVLFFFQFRIVFSYEMFYLTIFF